MARELLNLLLHAANYASHLFDVTASRSGLKKNGKAWAKIPHAEWIPAQLRQYGEEVNGHLLEWQSRRDGSERPVCRGRVELLALEHIYGDWVEHVYLEASEPADSRLRAFKIVDYFLPEACVGLYHDAQQDPGLYFYSLGEGEAPYPLHLDLRGYLRLLAVSLGYEYWQLALLRLLPDDGRNPAYRQAGNILEDFRRDMAAWDPEFDYAAFVALYHAVKLPSAPQG